jgi:hypothetical protein
MNRKYSLKSGFLLIALAVGFQGSICQGDDLETRITNLLATIKRGSVSSAETEPAFEMRDSAKINEFIQRTNAAVQALTELKDLTSRHKQQEINIAPETQIKIAYAVHGAATAEMFTGSRNGVQYMNRINLGTNSEWANEFRANALIRVTIALSIVPDIDTFNDTHRIDFIDALGKIYNIPQVQNLADKADRHLRSLSARKTYQCGPLANP